MKKAIYINTFSNGTHHEMVNAGMLIIVCRVYNQLLVFSGKSNLNNIEKISQVHSCNYRRRFLFVYSGSSKIGTFLRYLIGAFYNIIIAIFSSKKTTLFFNFNNVFCLKTLNSISRLKKQKMIIICHGEMELLLNYNQRGSLESILKKLATKFFINKKQKISPYIDFYVLGDSILNNLKPIIDDEKIESFRSIDHPYIFISRPIKNDNKDSRLSIGTIGTLNVNRGSNYYLELLEKLPNYLKSNINFSVIGKIYVDREKFEKNNVSLPIDQSYLSRSEFEKCINNLDYILFFYDSTNYKLTASGAIFDAISLEKPIIALRNDYFEYLFKKLGQFGILVDSIDNMIIEMENICLGKKLYKPDFSSIKSKLKPEFLLETFIKNLK